MLEQEGRRGPENNRAPQQLAPAEFRGPEHSGVHRHGLLGSQPDAWCLYSSQGCPHPGLCPGGYWCEVKAGLM